MYLRRYLYWDMQCIDDEITQCIALSAQGNQAWVNTSHPLDMTKDELTNFHEDVLPEDKYSREAIHSRH